MGVWSTKLNCIYKINEKICIRNTLNVRAKKIFILLIDTNCSSTSQGHKSIIRQVFESIFKHFTSDHHIGIFFQFIPSLLIIDSLYFSLFANQILKTLFNSSTTFTNSFTLSRSQNRYINSSSRGINSRLFQSFTLQPCRLLNIHNFNMMRKPHSGMSFSQPDQGFQLPRISRDLSTSRPPMTHFDVRLRQKRSSLFGQFRMEGLLGICQVVPKESHV